MEGDLASAPHATDLRDLYRPGSGLTLRRVLTLVRALPDDALFRHELRAAHELAESAEKLRHLKERQDHYAPKRRPA